MYGNRYLQLSDFRALINYKIIYQINRLMEILKLV